MLATATEKNQYTIHTLETELCNIANKDIRRRSELVTFCRYSQGRLIEKEEETPFGTTCYKYTYAKNGSIVEVQRNGVVVERYYYGTVRNSDNPLLLCDELASHGGTRRSFWYDKQNRLQECGNTQCTWKYNKLVRVDFEEYTMQLRYLENGMPLSVFFSHGKEVTYRYKNGKLAMRYENGMLSDKYVWDRNQLRCYYDVKNTTIYHFYYGAREEIRPTNVRIDTCLLHNIYQRNSLQYRLLWDMTGSLRGLYNSISGIVGYCEYDTYGNVLYEQGLRYFPLSYNGDLYDAETGIRFGEGSFSIPSLYVTHTVEL